VLPSRIEVDGHQLISHVEDAEQQPLLVAVDREHVVVELHGAAYRSRTSRLPAARETHVSNRSPASRSVSLK